MQHNKNIGFLMEKILKINNASKPEYTSFTKKILSFLKLKDTKQWENSHLYNDNTIYDTPKTLKPKTTIRQDNRNYEIPSAPTYKQCIQIEEDFPYIPFIKHCAANYSPHTTNFIFPNINEQHQILYFIDSFNKSLLDIGKELDINDLHIYTESVKFSYRNNRISEPMTFIDFCPYTPTGKKAKFPVSIVFSTEENSEKYSITSTSNDYETGRIDFMKDGNIGKAKITLFHNTSIYGIHYKMFGINLIIDKVTNTSRTGEKITEIYRNESTFS